jgi:hypothetical protein
VVRQSGKDAPLVAFLHEMFRWNEVQRPPRLGITFVSSRFDEYAAGLTKKDINDSIHLA